MYDVFNSYTIAENEREYLIEFGYDSAHGAPQDESDGHGIILTLGFNPDDDDEVTYYLGDEDTTDWPEKDILEVQEKRIRFSLMRELGNYSQHSRDKLYYDVWETMKIAARDGWYGATTQDAITAAVDSDFEYIDGWYSNDWHWAFISVTPLRPDPNDKLTEYERRLDEYTQSIAGVEYAAGSPYDDKYHNEMIQDLLSQCREAMAWKHPIPTGIGKA